LGGGIACGGGGACGAAPPPAVGGMSGAAIARGARGAARCGARASDGDRSSSARCMASEWVR
jgi:hypothetical protein